MAEPWNGVKYRCSGHDCVLELTPRITTTNHSGNQGRAYIIVCSLVFNIIHIIQTISSVMALATSPIKRTSVSRIPSRLLRQLHPRSRDPPWNRIPHNPPRPIPLPGYHEVLILVLHQVAAARGIEHVAAVRAKTVALRLEDLSLVLCVTTGSKTSVQGSARNKRPAFLAHYTHHLRARQTPTTSPPYPHSMTLRTTYSRVSQLTIQRSLFLRKQTSKGKMSSPSRHERLPLSIGKNKTSRSLWQPLWVGHYLSQVHQNPYRRQAAPPTSGTCQQCIQRHR